jgi:hypothetical protein
VAEDDDAGDDVDGGNNANGVDDESRWTLVFQRQCRTYVESLLRAYDAGRVSRLDDLMRRYNGREYDLVAALEQQYRVDHRAARSEVLRKVREYYRRMAPGREEDEAEVVVDRFGGRTERIWPFLYERYGPHPGRRGAGLRQSLRERLERYLARRAVHLLPQADRLIDECPMLSCESLFRDLTARFGPEDPEAEVEMLARRLSAFYRRRRLADAAAKAPTIARRFAGRAQLLDEVLARTFGDNLAHDDLDGL